jgi:hypothetical protein
MPMPDTNINAADPLVPVKMLGVGEVFIDNADKKPYCVLGPDGGGGANLAASVRDWFSKIEPDGVGWVPVVCLAAGEWGKVTWIDQYANVIPIVSARLEIDAAYPNTNASPVNG